MRCRREGDTDGATDAGGEASALGWGGAAPGGVHSPASNSFLPGDMTRGSVTETGEDRGPGGESRAEHARDSPTAGREEEPQNTGNVLCGALRNEAAPDRVAEWNQEVSIRRVVRPRTRRSGPGPLPDDRPADNASVSL